jgi:predicted ATP-grasp superfamily ATP-dependent carboligase
MPREKSIWIVGASARAAAASVIRAGYAPCCIDLFADADLATACPAVRIPLDAYPHGLFAGLDIHQPGPWMYTGGLENFPEHLDRPNLWGNGGDVVRAVRDPWRLFEELAGFAPPHLSDRPPPTNRWLVKPRRGSGGLGVRFWEPTEPWSEESVLQEYIPGIPASAVFAAVDGQCIFLGATRQLIGTAWLHVARPFQYAGSIGPLEALSPLVENLGQRLVERFQLRGLFGVDFIIDIHGRIRPIEINPRVPASLEILERIAGGALFAFHAAEFGRDDVPRVPGRAGLEFHGKAIYFAPSDLIVPLDGPWRSALSFPLDDLVVPFADVPESGSTIAKGDPVLTYFASGETMSECEAALRRIAVDLDAVFTAAPDSSA